MSVTTVTLARISNAATAVGPDLAGGDSGKLTASKVAGNATVATVPAVVAQAMRDGADRIDASAAVLLLSRILCNALSAWTQRKL